MVATDRIIYIVTKMNRSFVLILSFGILLNLFAENWQIQPLDSAGGFINDASIVLDTQDRPHIIYPWARQLGANLEEFWVKYAKWNGQAWEFQAVDTIVADGGPIFFSTKLCLDNQNHAHTAYLIRNYNPQTGRNWIKIIYTYWNGTSWQKSIIDSLNVTNDYVGAYIDQRNLDLALNHYNIPYLSYPYINLFDSTWQVRCAYKESDTWIIKTVWQQPLTLQTYRTRIAIDTADVPYITFDVNRNNQPPSLILCARFAGDTWTIETVDSFPTSLAFVYSLKIDGINRLHLLFDCDFYVFYALKQGNEWNIEFIGSSDENENHGDLALYQNEPYIVFSSPMTHVSYFYKDTAWHHEIIDSEYPGLYPSIAIDHQGNKHVSYVRFGYPCYLCYARRIAPGIEENEIAVLPRQTSNDFVVYPNPARTFFTIRLPQTANRSLIKIFDVTGKVVKELRSLGNRELMFTLKGIKPGIYFIQVDKYTKKIIVTK